MPPKRIRTTEGSCWSCKQRRVKCDLQKPICRKCIVAGTKCNFNKVLIKWNTRPTKGAPAENQSCLHHALFPDLGFASLAINEKRAIEYFRLRVWPLFSTSKEPCPPPIALAMEDRSVLLATCVIADSHRVLHDGRNSREHLQNKRLHCLAAVRKQLADASTGLNDMPLSTILVAVLLLYFSDGYVECTQGSASTSSHHAGANAIIDSLGGLPAIMTSGEKSIKLLLSEFATTDLTHSLLHGRRPSFPSNTWLLMDDGPVWWDKTAPGIESFASIFRKMSDLARYRDNILNGLEEFSIEKVQAFENELRPVYAAISQVALAAIEDSEEVSKPAADLIPAHALVRAFQHSATLYLYRAICNLPATHHLVQQHVQACLDCITGMPAQSKALNCSLFPLYTAGAHMMSESGQQAVIRKLDVVYENIKFDAVSSIRTALNDLWQGPNQMGTWFDMFSSLDPHTLVL